MTPIRVNISVRFTLVFPTRQSSCFSWAVSPNSLDQSTKMHFLIRALENYNRSAKAFGIAASATLMGNVSILSAKVCIASFHAARRCIRQCLGRFML